MFKQLLVLILLVVFAANANSANFLGESFSADYLKEEESIRGIKKSTGVIQFKAPNKFLIKQKKPFETILLSDGKKSWYIQPPFDPSEPPQVDPIDEKNNPLPHIFKGLRDGIKNNKVFSVATKDGKSVLTFNERYKKVLELESVLIEFKKGSSKNHFREISILTVMKQGNKKIEYQITSFNDSPSFSKDHFELKIKP